MLLKVQEKEDTIPENFAKYIVPFNLQPDCQNYHWHWDEHNLPGNNSQYPQIAIWI